MRGSTVVGSCWQGWNPPQRRFLRGLLLATTLLSTNLGSCRAADLTSPGFGNTAPAGSPPTTTVPPAVAPAPRPTLRPTSTGTEGSDNNDGSSPRPSPPSPTQIDSLPPTRAPIAWPLRPGSSSSNSSTSAGSADDTTEDPPPGSTSNTGSVLRAVGIGMLLLTVEAYVLLLCLARKRRLHNAAAVNTSKAAWEAVRRLPTNSTSDGDDVHDNDDGDGDGVPCSHPPPLGDAMDDNESASRVSYSLDGMQSLYSFRRGGGLSDEDAAQPPPILAVGPGDDGLVGEELSGFQRHRPHHPPVPQSIMLFI